MSGATKKLTDRHPVMLGYLAAATPANIALIAFGGPLASLTALYVGGLALSSGIDRWMTKDHTTEDLLLSTGYYVAPEVVDSKVRYARDHVTLTIRPDTSAIDVAFKQLGDAIRATGRSAADWARAILALFAGRPRPTSPPVPPHAFTPDYDLHCTVTGCALTPEEH